jgi:hypothetical protein
MVFPVAHALACTKLVIYHHHCLAHADTFSAACQCI